MGRREGRVVPCITDLTGLYWVSLTYLTGFRVHEWGLSRLAGLSHLRVLEIAACALNWLPAAIAGLSGLTWLGLRSNKLKVLPAGQYLHQLQVLDIVDNKFSTLPMEAIRAATALTRLAVEGNPLVWTPAQEEAVKHIRVVERD
jgi:hypothetical protein